MENHAEPEHFAVVANRLLDRLKETTMTRPTVETEPRTGREAAAPATRGAESGR